MLCCAPKAAACGHPKIYFKFSLQVPIPDLVRGSFHDFIKDEAQRQKNAPLCYPMCCALVEDVCRSPLTMMMFSTETLLSKTSSSCLLPLSVVPCAVLLLETPSGASYRKSLPKVHFKFSFEVPTSDLSRGSFPDFIRKEAQRNLRTCLMLSHPCVVLLLETSAGVH